MPNFSFGNWGTSNHHSENYSPEVGFLAAIVRGLPKAEHRLEVSDMASFKFLLDHDVRHLATSFPGKQVLMLEDVGLSQHSSDEEIVEAASERGCIIVTNNARDFEKEVPEHIATTSNKAKGCARFTG